MQTNPLLERGEAGEDEYGNADEVEGDAPNEAHPLDAPLHENGADNSDTPVTGDEDYPENTNLFESSFSEEIPLVKMESSSEELVEFDLSATTPDFSAEFGDDYDEFSNGSRWDENSTPADDDSDYKQQETLQISLREYLLSQLKLMPLSERDQTLTLLLVDSINDDGYLEESLTEIAEQMPLELEIDELELQTVLRLIQNLDPPGVGARNLSECLCLQLALLPTDTPHLALAHLVAKQHLPALGARDFTKLRKELGCDEATLKQVQQLITSLNPRPGSAYSHIGSEHYIQHEVIVKKVKGIWIASLN